MDTSLRRSLHRAALAGLASGLLLFGASSALAASIGLTFDGPADAGGKRWGVSGSSAAAAASAGVGILPAPMFNVSGNIEITRQELSQVTLGQGQLTTPFEITSDWTAEAQRSLMGSVVYLVFTSIDPRTITINGSTHDVNYDPSLVGLRLDPSQGWALVQSGAPGLGTLYYPAIRLGSLGDAQSKVVDIPYHLLQLETFRQNRSTILALPKLRIAVAFAPIPEPGTGLLMGVGLIALAVRKRARS